MKFIRRKPDMQIHIQIYEIEKKHYHPYKISVYKVFVY